MSTRPVELRPLFYNLVSSLDGEACRVPDTYFTIIFLIVARLLSLLCHLHRARAALIGCAASFAVERANQIIIKKTPKPPARGGSPFDSRGQPTSSALPFSGCSGNSSPQKPASDKSVQSTPASSVELTPPNNEKRPPKPPARGGSPFDSRGQPTSSALPFSGCSGNSSPQEPASDKSVRSMPAFSVELTPPNNEKRPPKSPARGGSPFDSLGQPTSSALPFSGCSGNSSPQKPASNQ